MKSADSYNAARKAVHNLTAHFAAHLAVAREDRNESQERGARSLLEDVYTLRAFIKEPAKNPGTHEDGCYPDPLHPGYWYCTAPGHVPSGHDA